MNRFRSVALQPDRLPQLLPFLFVALVLAGMAMQAKLLPVKPMRMEFPPSIDASPGAAPKDSVAPPIALPSFDAPSSVLPRESVPDDTLTASPEPSVAMLAPTIEAPFAGAVAGAIASPAGLSGSGNLALRANRGQAVSVLTRNLLQTVERIRANMRPPAKAARRSTALKAQQAAAKHPTPLAIARTSLPQSSLGGAAASWGGLGGPAPPASGLSGTTMRRKY
ncbi:MAG TPA: hypothetical protein VEI03_02955 [Stellaceae bacterium]|nr:hypothetical protein [Stellaceae bacterium]